MPKIVGYVGSIPPTEEHQFPWKVFTAVGAGAVALVWFASKLGNRLVMNPISEFKTPVLAKISEEMLRARGGEAKVLPPENVIKELAQLPPGRYTFDLDPDFASRKRSYSRNRWRRYKDSTTMRGAFFSAIRAADGSDSKHVLVDTQGEPTGDATTPYTAASPVVLGIFREDGEPEFLIYTDQVSKLPEFSKEERQARRAERQAKMRDRAERRTEIEIARDERRRKADELREQRRLEREQKLAEKEQARILLRFPD